MKKFIFKKLDAFATASSTGNPAGAIYLEVMQDISVQEMQRIAKELKGFVSEVGYIRPVDEDTLALKYYSSEREVDFCGHATIALMYDTLKNNEVYKHKSAVTILTNKGKLLVENRIEQDDAVFISAPQPRFSAREIEKEPLAEALQISPEGIDCVYPISIINAGLETLIVPIKALQTTLTMMPSLEPLKEYCQKIEVDVITVFTDEVANPANAFRSRVFAPTFGYLEDPATGSGNAALGYYLLQQGSWDGTSISLEQNNNRSNPNIVKILAKPCGEDAWQVIFGGNAITRICGEYWLV